MLYMHTVPVTKKFKPPIYASGHGLTENKLNGS